MKKILKAITLSTLLLFSVYSCTNQINTTSEIKSIKPEKTGKVLVGKAVFPNDKKELPSFKAKTVKAELSVTKEKSLAPVITNKEVFKEKNNTVNLKKISISTIKRKNTFKPQKRPANSKAVFPNVKEERKVITPFKTKALPSDVSAVSTISVIIPSDSATTPNKTIGTGITDSLGNFQIDLSGITLANNSIYVLEASKRTAKYVETIRTYIKWNGTAWESITTGDALINEITTSVSIIAGLTNISSINLISKVDPLNITDIKDSTNTTVLITKDDILKVSNLTNSVLLGEKDPVTLIKYDASKPYKFFVDQPYNYANLVTKNKCKGCTFIPSELLASGVSLAGKDLSYADLSGFDLSNKDLSNTILVNANLSGVTLNQTNLTGSDLSGANLTGAIINNPIISGASFFNSNFSNSNIINTDFSYIDVSRSIFKNATISNCNIEGTYFTGSNFENAIINFSTINLKDANISNSNFTGLDLSNKDLSDVNFTGSNFTNVNLSNSNFTNSDLSNIDFTNVNLSNSNLSNTNLTDSIFKNTNLSNTNFTYADLEFTTLLEQDFTGANFSSALFYKKNFAGSNISNANLKGAVFTGASFFNTNISGSNFEGAVLYNSNFNSVDNLPPPIVQSLDISGNNDIVALDQLDTSLIKQLTTSSTNTDYPSVSLDGKKITYVETDTSTGDQNIYIMDIDGTNQIQLTNSTDLEYEPVFSPDNTKIFYTREINGQNEIYSMNIDGTNQTNITNNPVRSYLSSSTSPYNKITFYSPYSATEYAQIYTSNFDGSSLINLTFDSVDELAPKFSRDGKKIAFLSNRDTLSTTGIFELWVMNSDGTNKKKIVSNDIQNFFWSDDNMELFYTFLTDTGKYQTAVVNILTEYITANTTTTNEYAIDWLHGKTSETNIREKGLTFYSDRSGNGYQVYSSAFLP